MNWAGLTKPRAEQSAIEQMRALGIEAHAAFELKLEAKGKNRRPSPRNVPILPRTVFIRGPGEHFHLLGQVRDLTGTMITIGDRTWERQVVPFLTAAQEAFDADLDRFRLGELVDQYERGEELLAKLGPFKDKIVQFWDTVERAHDDFPKLRGEIEFMGRKTLVELDPLHVKRAG